MKSVATLYRWSVPAKLERQLIVHWRSVARELRRRGALACLLMRSDSGDLVGLIRWPSDYVRSEALKGAESHVWPGISGGWEAKLTIEDSVVGGPSVPLGLAL